MIKNILYQVSSHWDREWYLQFQGFRFYLVKMVSKLLDDLDNGKIAYFNLDGQTIVLEDYLEICPEDRERIKKHIKEGKLAVGPWYVMPDELLVSGESLIHNLLLGKSVAADFDCSTQKLGYVNDVFGHIAQMPQIFNGFGIDSVYLGRGVGGAHQNYTNFMWYSPNGSKCYSYKQVYARFKKKFDCAKDKTEVFLNEIQPLDTEVPVTVLNYTGDHAFIDENTYEFEKCISRASDENVIAGIDRLSEFLKPYEDKLPKENGELITTAEKSDCFSAVTHSISSYYPLKKENDECENLIYSKLAPIMVMSEISGIDIRKKFYDIACRYLIKNQPHDSICGCSVDKVHKDMLYRYSQVKSIVDVVSTYFSDSVSIVGNDMLNFTVFNFDIHKKSGPIMVDIEFPKEWSCVYENKNYYKKTNMFSILDSDGREVFYQILKIERDVPKYNMQEEKFVDVYTVAFDANLNSFGTTTYKIVPADKPAIYPKVCSDIKLGAENKYLSFEINADGSVNLTDKKSGKVYENLNTFTDDGDCGNGWFYTKADIGESIISSTGSPCTIEIIHQGPIYYRYRITKLLEIPKTLSYDNYRRSEEKITMKIVTEISLNGDDKKLLFDTTVYNNAENHRLRVHFPTGISGNTYKASQAFCFVERQRGVDEKGIVSFEPEPYEKNTSGIVSVVNGEESLSFIGANGIHEAGVSKDGVISVTLFRSVGRMFHETNPTFCQLQEDMNFKYALSFEKDNSTLCNMQRDMNVPLYSISDMCINTKSSLIEADNNGVVLSIVKPSLYGNNVVLRIYNPSEIVAETKIRIDFEFKNIYEAFMSEEKISDCDVEENKFFVKLNPYEIKTFIIAV